MVQMTKIIKYTTEVPASDRPECKEGYPGCDPAAGAVHVCFEDGSGVTVCNSCFERILNEGRWISDSTVRLRATL
jgi:hypothetical protein